MDMRNAVPMFDPGSPVGTPLSQDSPAAQRHRKPIPEPLCSPIAIDGHRIPAESPGGYYLPSPSPSPASKRYVGVSNNARNNIYMKTLMNSPYHKTYTPLSATPGFSPAYHTPARTRQDKHESPHPSVTSTPQGTKPPGSAKKFLTPKKKNVPVNPFENGVDDLHLPAYMSPGFFTVSSTPASEEKKMFSWNIEHIAELRPADIDEMPTHQAHHVMPDRETEERAQRAIEHFFATNLIHPSPFADDMVVIGENPHDLQCSLNKLHDYCNKWGLEVNVEKSKIVVFRKRGGLKAGENWSYDEENIEIVNFFNYLGVTLNYTGNFNLNTEALYGKSLKAMNNLVANLTKYETKPKIALQLFDSFVGSILMYASEVWGFCKSKKLENIHVKFCKTILGVRKSSSNVAVYGELGRYPLYLNRYIRIIKFWFKIIGTSNVIIESIVKSCISDISKGYINWFSNVRSLLEKYGFLNVWLNPSSVNQNQFIAVFKQRLLDEYIQEWRASVNTNDVLILYRSVKDNFGIESYLENIISRNLRIAFTKLRISAHSLRIQTGRYSRDRIDHNLRYCLICNQNEIEDEFHFVLKCPAYENLRKIHIKRYYRNRPNMHKFVQLLRNDTNKETILLCKYINEAFKMRYQIINS